MAYKILVVDDEEHIVKILMARLKAFGYDVVAAYDAVQAVRMAHQERPDLILLDLRMPAGGGISVFENLSMTTDAATTPVIFITAHASEEVCKEIMTLGAADFITKPFDSDDLLAKIKKVLDPSA